MINSDSDNFGKTIITYLDVNYNENKECKSMGGKWDSTVKKWYCSDEQKNYKEMITRWGPKESTFLEVPFCEKDECKELGCKFDKETKQWYIHNDSPNYQEVLNKWQINTEPVVLKGEKRKFGGNQLFIDLIPKTSWFSNIRYGVHQRDWDRLRKHIYSRADNKCECCGSSEKLECHERFDYNNDTKIQKLMRLICLCSKCHLSTHMGYAEESGKEKEAIEQFKTVTKMTDVEYKKHYDEAFKLWRERNKTNWTVDLSLISNNGIQLNPDKKNDV